MKKNNINETFNEELFENELHNSLKYFGFLFPETSKDVERFEQLYGDTEIDTPTSDEILKEKVNARIVNFDEILDNNINMAAYASKDESFLKPDEEESDDKDSKDQPNNDQK